MPQPNVRVLGSNYTTFQYAGRTLAYLEVVADSGITAGGGDPASPVGRSHEFVHPLGAREPTDIVTSRILTGGTLTLQVRELWNRQVWEQMAGLAGTRDVVQVFERLAAQPNYVTCTKIVNPPRLGGVAQRRYGTVYHKCTIINVPDGEEITIGALSIAKPLTVAYTHKRPL